MQFQNLTPFPALMWEYTNHEHVECAVAMVRVQFRLSQTSIAGHYELQIDPKQGELYAQNQYFDDSMEICHPTDMVPYKPYTDLIMNVVTYPDSHTSEKSWECGVKVHNDHDQLVHHKSLRVYGRRQLKKQWFSRTWKLDNEIDKETSVPIRYTNAYGGEIHMDTKGQLNHEDIVVRNEENPIGIGLTHKDDPRKVIEAPKIAKLNSKENSMEGFGAIGTSWQTRFSRCGTYDAKWLETVCPLLPNDFDPLFYHSAHPDMILKQEILSNYIIEMTNLHPTISSISIKIPSLSMVGRFSTNTFSADLPLRIDTIVIQGNYEDIKEWRLFLTYRNNYFINEPLSGQNIVFFN